MFYPCVFQKFWHRIAWKLVFAHKSFLWHAYPLQKSSISRERKLVNYNHLPFGSFSNYKHYFLLFIKVYIHSFFLDAFVNYYKVTEQKSFVKMNNDYTNLTVNNMLFLILCNMGKTDSQICKILGVGPDTPRVMK